MVRRYFYKNNSSAFEWYDSELNPIGTAFYLFSGASVSQTNAHVQNDTVFLTPVGEEQKKDYEKITLINPIKGSFEEIVSESGQDKIDILGWSWGTVTASRYAAKHSEHLNRLVLYAPILSGIGAYEVTDDFHHNI